MNINLDKLARTGKNVQDFAFKYFPTENLCLIPNAEILTPLCVRGSVELMDNKTCVVSGEVIFSVKGECTRCLAQTTREFSFEFEEKAGNAEEEYPIKNNSVDIDKIADDVILMNLPLNFLCSETCKGICLKCGKNLNKGDCDCK